MDKKRIVIFASGNGTNAENIIKYFQDSELAEVVLVLANSENAKVLERAKNLNVSTTTFTKAELFLPDGIIKKLISAQPDLIVLAGFLLKFPQNIITEFPHKIINIHPALLPKYGGKGMYGQKVHETVIANKELETGITIHYVNENYDEGAIIFQKTVPVLTSDTAESVAKKVHSLEYEWFPKVIEGLLKKEQ
ncbi:phosphoribosylglycinamide formyltransferase [Aequorivita sp. H23M31]|uniref:Phosphoribosylglycinamide formyltransferase n=1 Tax=Aequorivita ciconiae TaxID=2494375 RepID=A0A410G5F6_9FLAO|nr:phosphoribosylglycinamide formyltransferase [Aequorivita sp. H23M31]QAA82425.1 phosphoribosylglycinamide formyltransferase [Aequorivita sp. H23M31]